MSKLKINELAKDLDITGKEIIAVLKEYGVDKKSTMSVLENAELDVVFEVYTQKFDDGTPPEELFEKFSQDDDNIEILEDTVDDIIDIKVDAPATRSVRHVDTRANTVDVERYERKSMLENIVPTMTDIETTRQKIKKGITNKKVPVNSIPQKPVKQVQKPKKLDIEITMPEVITVGELAQMLKSPAAEIIKRLMLIDKDNMLTINDILDFDTASLIAEDMGAKVTKEIIISQEDILFNDITDDPDTLITRPPVVVVMGHVDHGKTSLLDCIRKTSVTATEAGGITQHIGAYSVNLNGRAITFLDTPGHEAFTAMRARGAQVTDIAILVVAADDGIMPQTIEAINHAKAAGITIIVAINKIDKEGANLDRVKQGLTEYELLPEDWGGETICVPVSALKGEGIDELLEMVLLVADMKDLKANPDRRAKGTVVESKLDKNRGPVATILVQNGTLNVGDLIVAGTSVGKIRAMTDYKGKKITTAGPSTPVEVIGLSEVPDGGDIFYCVENERMARAVVENRKHKFKDDVQNANKRVTLDDLFAQISQGEVKDLNIIIKADVQGSVEAVKQSLLKLTNEEVRVNIIHGGVGAVNETDVMLADASNAIIVGFNVRPTTGAIDAIEIKKVDVRLYRIIYQAIEEIEAAMKGMLTPKYKEVITGHAEVRQTFKVTGVGTIAGCMVKDGKISRNIKVRIVRDGIVVHEGNLSSLKRFKDDAKEVSENFECGISIEKFNDIKDGDIIEGFVMQEIER